MACKKIIWSKRASTELKHTLDFYTDRNGSPTYSLTLLSQIEDLLDKLSQQEGMGRLTTNGKTRVIVMKVYCIFYELNGNQIETLSFWDNRQNPEKRIDH